MLFTVIFLTTLVKLLLLPAYRSTDFEVHRNWMAITYNLPIKEWYYEKTSEWTLDYPPLFAYFEYLLSSVAAVFDRNMLVVENLNYASKATVIFQRISVIFTDLVYVYGTYRCCTSIPKNRRSEVVLPILLITNCGLIMIDHIHFQYNGVLYGILLISLAAILQDKYLESAFWFTILLCMKHIYIYLAPAYFVFLLKNYCLKDVKSIAQLFSRKVFWNFTLLGSLVLSIFLLVFLPFYDQIGQVVTRLFPFKRGLCHAYWAPNFWAFYNTLDKILSLLFSKLGFTQKTNVASMTGGLVQEFSHEVLPNITPTVTIVLTGLTMLPALIKLWTVKKPAENFLRVIVLCAFSSFLFGWHVHEKAIIMAIIPLSILSIININDTKNFLLVSIVGHYSLFPLLFPQSLTVIKVLLLLVYSIYSFLSLLQVHSSYVKYECSLPLLNHIESLYILGLFAVFSYENFFHYILNFHEKLPYLSLLLTSFYCSIGIFYSYINFYMSFLNSSSSIKVLKKKY